jgi:lysylphosphatidylglycerol synthetase-like protein (DUF2156 family)
MRSKLGQDFWAGAMFIAFGIAAIAIARGYKLGSLEAMGPGYVPIAVGVLLVVFGLAMAARSLARGSERVGELAWFAAALVLIGILVFAFFVRSVGLALTAIVLALLCRVAGRYFGLRENALLAVVLAVLVVAIFGYGLKLSLPLWPGQD